MRISIRTGLSAIVLACVVVSAGTVHLAWNRVADANSRGLAAMLSRQVATTVREDLAARIGEAEAAYGALRTIFVQDVIDSREADRREFVFLSQLQAQPALSWVAFGWADGSFFGSHKLGDAALEMIEIADGAGTRRTDRIGCIRTTSSSASAASPTHATMSVSRTGSPRACGLRARAGSSSTRTRIPSAGPSASPDRSTSTGAGRACSR